MHMYLYLFTLIGRLVKSLMWILVTAMACFFIHRRKAVSSLNANIKFRSVMRVNRFVVNFFIAHEVHVRVMHE